MPTAVLMNGEPAAPSPPGCSARAVQDASVPAHKFAGSARCPPPPGRCWRKPSGLCRSLRHTVFFSGDYPLEFQIASSTWRCCRTEPTTYVCARRTVATSEGAAPTRDRSGCCCWSMPPPSGDTHRGFSPSRRSNSACSGPDGYGLMNRCGVADPGGGGAGADHPGAFQPPVPGLGRERCMARRRCRATMAVLQAAGGADEAGPGAVSGGGQRASGGGRADGDAVGPAGGGQHPAGHDGAPRFDAPVPPTRLPLGGISTR